MENIFNKKLQELKDEYQKVYQDFEIEKDCKNDAYYFILSAGYFEEYRNWQNIDKPKFEDFRKELLTGNKNYERTKSN